MNHAFYGCVLTHAHTVIHKKEDAKRSPELDTWRLNTVCFCFNIWLDMNMCVCSRCEHCIVLSMFVQGCIQVVAPYF